MKPLVSVITICYNDPIGLAKTIESVISQNYPRIEYIVIDGGSSNETQDILKKNKEYFNFVSSEPDKGIYDAMNKGLINSTGEWYIMMNSGDTFAFSNSVLDNIDLITSSNASWGGGGSLVKYKDGSERYYFSSPNTGVYHQQSVFVKRTIHEHYGYFIVNNSSKAWDYFFFNIIRNEPFKQTGKLVAICDGTGVSSSVDNYLHATAISYLFGTSGRHLTAIKLLLYPLYRRNK